MNKIFDPQVDPNIKLIEGDDQLRAENSLKKIQNILRQSDCVIHPEITLNPTGPLWGWSVVAIPRELKSKMN